MASNVSKMFESVSKLLSIVLKLIKIDRFRLVSKSFWSNFRLTQFLQSWSTNFRIAPKSIQCVPHGLGFLQKSFKIVSNQEARMTKHSGISSNNQRTKFRLKQINAMKFHCWELSSFHRRCVLTHHLLPIPGSWKVFFFSAMKWIMDIWLIGMQFPESVINSFSSGLWLGEQVLIPGFLACIHIPLIEWFNDHCFGHGFLNCQRHNGGLCEHNGNWKSVDSFQLFGIFKFEFTEFPSLRKDFRFVFPSTFSFHNICQGMVAKAPPATSEKVFSGCQYHTHCPCFDQAPTFIDFGAAQYPQFSDLQF